MNKDVVRYVVFFTFKFILLKAELFLIQTTGDIITFDIVTSAFNCLKKLLIYLLLFSIFKMM